MFCDGKTINAFENHILSWNYFFAFSFIPSTPEPRSAGPTAGWTPGRPSAPSPWPLGRTRKGSCRCRSPRWCLCPASWQTSTGSTRSKGKSSNHWINIVGIITSISVWLRAFVLGIDFHGQINPTGLHSRHHSTSIRHNLNLSNSSAITQAYPL